MSDSLVSFGSRRIYYNNFAEHLLNAYNPNMCHPGLPYRWSDEDWRRQIDMVAAFGFNVFEFWLVPSLFCREGMDGAVGREFARQMNETIRHAHTRGIKVEALCGLATSGAAWHTLCPNVPEEWREIRYLWEEWSRRLPELDIFGIFPGDPGACSRNGCTALTYIDRSLEIAQAVKRVLPAVEVEFGTWGPPFFGWGNIEGPPGWKGEFIASYQHTAWHFTASRAQESMRHLVRRLPEFPDGTSVALNMGFGSDGLPEGERDARPWAREIARTHRVYTWDFSLTEGENAILPHWRFDRLLQTRRAEREAGAYSGGICFTMTPLLNQLSLYEAAQSFLRPDADPTTLAEEFYARLFGSAGKAVVPFLPLFEVIWDWGNYTKVELARSRYHARLRELTDVLEGLTPAASAFAFHPDVESYRRELLFYARLFAELSGPSPDYAGARKRYWDRVYRIYDHLPPHVDPRPHMATDKLIAHFAEWEKAPEGLMPVVGKWSV